MPFNVIPAPGYLLKIFCGPAELLRVKMQYIKQSVNDIHIYTILNYKSHKRDFIRTSTVCFAFSAHQEVILNADEKLRKNA